jgi:hypothetical protein
MGRVDDERSPAVAGAGEEGKQEDEGGSRPRTSRCHDHPSDLLFEMGMRVDPVDRDVSISTAALIELLPAPTSAAAGSVLER